MSVCPQPGKLRTDGRTIDSSEVGVGSDVARCINRLRRRKSAIRYFSPGGALVQILHGNVSRFPLPRGCGFESQWGQSLADESGDSRGGVGDWLSDSQQW